MRAERCRVLPSTAERCRALPSTAVCVSVRTPVGVCSELHYAPIMTVESTWMRA